MLACLKLCATPRRPAGAGGGPPLQPYGWLSSDTAPYFYSSKRSLSRWKALMGTFPARLTEGVGLLGCSGGAAELACKAQAWRPAKQYTPEALNQFTHHTFHPQCPWCCAGSTSCKSCETGVQRIASAERTDVHHPDNMRRHQETPAWRNRARKKHGTRHAGPTA